MLPKFAIHFKALGGINELQVFAENERMAHKVATKVVAEVRRIEAKYSRFKENSIISLLAKNAGKESIKVDSETAGLINFANACYVDSGGLFDITSGILQKVWDFNSAKLPTSNEIIQATKLVGWNKVEWEEPWIRLPIEGMRLDFGGIGKEYAVDRAAEILLEEGLQNSLVNFAGDVRAVGPRADGRAWQIGITHPRKPNSAFTSIGLFSGSLATSGDYERFKIIDGVRYCHIINPFTGYPVDQIQSASVLSESCMVAGSLSTLAMLLGPSKGSVLLARAQTPHMFILQDRCTKHMWPGVSQHHQEQASLSGV